MFDITRYEPRRLWGPLTTFRNVQEEMDRFFDDFFTGGHKETALETGWYPAVDVLEDNDKFTLKAEVPGMTEKDVKITVEENAISIHGEKKEEKEEKGLHYHKLERSYGAFSRNFQLPSNINRDQISAQYRDGILEITLPKTTQSKPKIVEIKAS